MCNVRSGLKNNETTVKYIKSQLLTSLLHVVRLTIVLLWTGYVIFCQKLHHWSSSWSHRCLQWRPCKRPCHHRRGKVTGATQKLVSAVCHTHLGLTNVCTVQKPSTHDLPMQFSSQWVRPQFGRANNFLALRIDKKHQVGAWRTALANCVFLCCSHRHLLCSCVVMMVKMCVCVCLYACVVTTIASTRCKGQDQHQCKSERDVAATCNSNHNHHRPAQDQSWINLH